MKAIAGAFGLIPGWVWAMVCAALLLTNCTSLTRMQAAQVAKARAEQRLADTLLRHEKALGAETASVLRLERELGAARAEQEKRDAENKSTVAGLREELRRKSRAGGGGGLRDPHAAPSSCPAAGAGAPSAAGGAGDAAEASGLVSAPLERLLLELVAESDAINIAYASCREDSMNLRLRLNMQLSPPPGAPDPGPAPSD